MKTKTRFAMTLFIFGAVFVFFGSRPAAANTYQIPIEISVPASATEDADATKAYNKLVLGVQPGATENYDPQWDTPAFFTTPNAETPPLLKAAIQHPEYAGNQRELWRDIRSDAGGGTRKWDLSVALALSEIGKTVTLAWILPPSLASSGKRVTLTDPESDTAIDMRSQSSYQFIQGSSSPRMLSVTVNPSSGSSDNGSSGFLGCGVVTPVKPGPPSSGTGIAILLNLLILLSPILFRFWPRDCRSGQAERTRQAD